MTSSNRLYRYGPLNAIHTRTAGKNFRKFYMGLAKY